MHNLIHGGQMEIIIIHDKELIMRELIKIQVSRLANFGKPQFTVVNEDFTKFA